MTTQDPLVGHTLAGKYVIERFVREEGLGKVYEASILPVRTPVAVKVLHPHLVEDKEAFGRFGREMLATAAVNHPNSVKMFDFGEHRGIFHFIVLERLWAHPLSDEISQGGPLSFDRVCAIAGQIASVMITAHGENIVHRNLSSQNVLLLDNARDGDYVKIRDFGMSRLNGDRPQGDDEISNVETRVGTVAYMSPEYIDAGVVDARSDLYALGILMYEMLTGAPPFAGRAAEVLEAHIRDVPPPPSTKAVVPLWLDALVATLLEKDPLMRPRNAAEVLTALQRGTGKRLDPPELATEPQPRHTPGSHMAATGDEGGGSGMSPTTMLAIGVTVVVLISIVFIVTVMT